MDNRSVFYEEWRRSLREQYKHVARNDDRVTLSSLTKVMLGVGFRESELAQLRVEATMRVDDVADGFRADMQILDERPAAQAHPAECLCPDCAPIDESQFDSEGQPLAADPEAEGYEAGHIIAVADASGIAAPPDTEPVTFEDGVVAEAELLDPPEAVSPDPDESDPDAPAQMNLF